MEYSRKMYTYGFGGKISLWSENTARSDTWLTGKRSQFFKFFQRDSWDLRVNVRNSLAKYGSKLILNLGIEKKWWNFCEPSISLSIWVSEYLLNSGKKPEIQFALLKRFLSRYLSSTDRSHPHPQGGQQPPDLPQPNAKEKWGITKEMRKIWDNYLEINFPLVVSIGDIEEKNSKLVVNKCTL